MDDERRVKRARTFDEDAELYDRARGGYPDDLFDDLFALAEIAPADAEVLEIGCGTGQATLPLARSGCRIVCVEPGANMVRVARRKLAQFPRVAVVNASLEDWDPGGETFNMVFAATAWHWVDPQVRYAKAASVLRPDGVLAFTTWNHGFPQGFDPFFTEIQRAYETIGEGTLAWPPPSPDKVADEREEIAQSGAFEPARVVRYLWISEFTADEYVDMMSTASDHRLMEPAKRQWLFAEMRRLINARPGGRIRRHNLSILHVARRKS